MRGFFVEGRFMNQQGFFCTAACNADDNSVISALLGMLAVSIVVLRTQDRGLRRPARAPVNELDAAGPAGCCNGVVGHPCALSTGGKRAPLLLLRHHLKDSP